MGWRRQNHSLGHINFIWIHFSHFQVTSQKLLTRTGGRDVYSPKYLTQKQLQQEEKQSFWDFSLTTFGSFLKADLGHFTHKTDTWVNQAGLGHKYWFGSLYQFGSNRFGAKGVTSPVSSQITVPDPKLVPFTHKWACLAYVYPYEQASPALQTLKRGGKPLF